MTRTAISPRLAIRIFCSTAANVGGVGEPDPLARPRRLAGGLDRRARRATGSTNADLLATAPTGARTAACSSPTTRRPGGDDSTGAGTRRPAANLLVSLLFHDVPEPSGRADPTGQPGRRRRVRRGGGVQAVAEVAERRARRRRQAGRRPGPADRRRAVVVGIGLNVGWCPTAPPGSAMTSTRSTCSPRCSPPTTPSGRRRRALPAAAGDARPRGAGRAAGRRSAGRPTDVEPDGRLVVVDGCGAHPPPRRR